MASVSRESTPVPPESRLRPPNLTGDDFSEWREALSKLVTGKD